MSDQIELSAELRTDVGKGASRRLRRIANRIPGIMYGGSEDAVPLTLNRNELSKAMQQEAFYSQILQVTLNGKPQQAVVRDLQRDPGSERVLHLDFLRVSADRAIQVSVPLHFLNEDKCEGVRLGGGSIAHNISDVEISCLPGALPEYIEVDMEHLDIGDSVHLSDLVMPEGVILVALSYGDDHDLNIASVVAPRAATEDVDVDEGTDASAEGGDDAATPEADDTSGD